VDGDGGTEYVLISRLLSLGDMHPLPGLSLSLQAPACLACCCSTPSPSLVTSRTEAKPCLPAAAAAAASLFFEAIPPSPPALQRSSDSQLHLLHSFLGELPASCCQPAAARVKMTFLGMVIQHRSTCRPCQFGQGCLVEGSGFPVDLLMRR
jgi:hypothetical protein